MIEVVFPEPIHAPMTMREKAARAICRFDPVCATACEECTGDVDAVLDAIREPTKAMCFAALPKLVEGIKDKSAETEPTVSRVYVAMIDAIKRGEA